MSQSPPTAAESTRLEAAVAEYLESIERGESPSRDELLSRYDDVADELQQFFADHDRINGLASPLRSLIVEASLVTSSDRNTGGIGPTLAPSPDTSSQSGNEPQWKFGDYEIQRELGRGGMGVVYLARHTRLRRVVALKMVRLGEFASKQDNLRFQDEARAAAALDHPGIVPVYEAGDLLGRSYFAMAFIEGPTLAEWLREGPLAPMSAVKLLRKIAMAVAYAHARGIIHRDLKPGNILLAGVELASDDAARTLALETCQPKIADFGLAKYPEAEEEITMSGQILGTPSYMPPEQAAGRTQEIRPHSDVYSLGAIFYALLTGKPPFVAENPVEVILQVLEAEPVLPRRIRAEIPIELEAICLKCLEKKPADRYETADELIADLDRVLRHEPPEARSPTLLQRFRRWMRRQPALAWHTIGIATMLLVVQFIYAAHPERDLQYHVIATSTLAAWLGVCALLQYGAENKWSAYLWSIADVVFLTALLSLLVSPLGMLFGAYPLLICASGLFARPRLVALTTAAALVGFAALLLMRPADAQPLHYALLCGATIVITGFVVGYQTWRMRVLHEYYDLDRSR